MSTLRDPVGPQPKSVYWRRRLIVLLALVAVIVVIALIVWPRGNAAPDAGSDPSESATGSSAPVEESSAPPTDAASPGCASDQIELLAIVDENSYDAGVLPQLSLSISNLGAETCSLNVGTSQQVFQITSGEETYWLSTDCQQAPADQVLDLQPATPLRTDPIAWNRTRSSPDTCDETDKPEVPAGGASYHLTVKLGEKTSENDAQFLLY